MFANLENQFKHASKEELVSTAVGSALELHKALDNGDNGGKTAFMFLIIGTRIGVSGDGVINSDEKALIEEVFGKLWQGDMSTIYDMIGTKSSEGDYEIVSDIVKLGNHIAMPFLRYILSFAYIDGVLEDEVAEKLDSLFGVNFLADFTLSGSAEVPTPKVDLTDFEAELVGWFQKDGGLKPLKDIVAQFPGKTKTEVQKALDSLVGKGVLCGGANFADFLGGSLYGLTHCEADETAPKAVEDTPDTLLEKAEEIIKQSRKKLVDCIKELTQFIRDEIRDWERAESQYKREVSELQAKYGYNVVINRTYDEVRTMKGKIREKQKEYRKASKEILEGVSKQGEELLQKGADSRTVEKFVKFFEAVPGIIKDYSFDEDYILECIYGALVEHGCDGSRDYLEIDVPSNCESVLKRWREKYNNMPEIVEKHRLEKLEEDIRKKKEELEQISRAINNCESEVRSNQFRVDRLARDVGMLTADISKAEESLEADKAAVNEEAEEILSSLDAEIQRLKTKKESLGDQITQQKEERESLPFFKPKRKKELDQSIQDLNEQLKTVIETSDKTEKRRMEEVAERNKKVNDLVIHLQDMREKRHDCEKQRQQLEIDIRGLKQKISEMTRKKESLPAEIEALEKQRR
jgi:hypothetical protein